MNFKLLHLIFFLLAYLPLNGQVYYKENGEPWIKKATGPDQDVPGWFYNLGITGIRAKLMADKPKFLEVKYTFKKSPSYRKILIGDVIIGAGGKLFINEHKNGIGMDKFGADGPIEEFAEALALAQTSKGRGRLELIILRNSKELKVSLNVGRKYGDYSSTFPFQCPKSDKIVKELLDYLIDNQSPNGSFGTPQDNLYAPLALMASGSSKYRKAIKRNVYLQASATTSSGDKEWLVNWKYMTAAIVLSEYYLRYKDRKILKELQEIYDFLYTTQYTDMSQIDKKDPLGTPSRPNPESPDEKHGGWGHNPGYEGYGPISILTGAGALGLTLMSRCGIKIDETRHKKAYDFLERGTGKNGYTWYADKKGADDAYAGMGRTGVSAIAHWLSPYGEKHQEYALLQSKLIGNYPKSFPDTHASPLLGMGYAALGANIDKKNFLSLMHANKYWFTLAQCHDGTFCYQPNRESQTYAGNWRVAASAVTAFILLIKEKSLVITGKNYR